MMTGGLEHVNVIKKQCEAFLVFSHLLSSVLFTECLQSVQLTESVLRMMLYLSCHVLELSAKMLKLREGKQKVKTKSCRTNRHIQLSYLCRLYISLFIYLLHIGNLVFPHFHTPRRTRRSTFQVIYSPPSAPRVSLQVCEVNILPCLSSYSSSQVCLSATPCDEG